ncbi:hypothetical protein D7M10_23130 [Pseudomonas fluorescens]|nr:hypothetical protein D7M10_23130 [Pseudomonas fluorescens]
MTDTPLSRASPLPHFLCRGVCIASKPAPTLASCHIAFCVRHQPSAVSMAIIRQNPMHNPRLASLSWPLRRDSGITS